MRNASDVKETGTAADTSDSPVKEDLRSQRTTWLMQRVMWVLLALVPLAAITGVFAHGIFSDKIARTPNGSLIVEYERFQRQSVQWRLLIRVADAQTDEVRLRLNSAFHQAYEVQSMQPAPLRSRADPDGLELFFRRPESGELVVVIWNVPRQFGSLQLMAQTDTSGPVEFPVFIYP
jgi:hypothetical protein